MALKETGPQINKNEAWEYLAELFRGLDNRKHIRNYINMENFIKNLREKKLYHEYQEDASLFLRDYLSYLEKSLKETNQSS